MTLTPLIFSLLLFPGLLVLHLVLVRPEVKFTSLFPVPHRELLTQLPDSGTAVLVSS